MWPLAQMIDAGVDDNVLPELTAQLEEVGVIIGWAGGRLIVGV